MNNWRDVVVSPTTMLREAIARIDVSGITAALVVDERDRLVGLLTDGNVRRAILAGRDLDTPTGEVMQRDPTAVPLETSRSEMLAVMRRHGFNHLPVVDADRTVLDLVTLAELAGGVERPTWVVLMAGGLGTRLHPLTEERPKPLLNVGGKPILETLLEGFADQGFKHVFFAVNYKADMIQSHFGDGSRWGINLRYLVEETRMGTAGALSLLPGLPAGPMIVMNGDLLTQVNYDGMLRFHDEHRAAATMAVKEYDMQVPYGVVRLDGPEIRRIEEKPVQHFFVNAGIYVLSPEVLARIPARSFVDMPALFHDAAAAGFKTIAYPMREHWIDIGRLEELERAQREWDSARASRP